MSVLVDDLLLLARLDQGRPLEQEPVDLVALASDAVDDARAVSPDRPITFETNGPVTVTGDEARLRQVTANLLANARVHTPEGTRVHVRVLSTDDGAQLEVADEGPGLAPDEAARVRALLSSRPGACARRRRGPGSVSPSSPPSPRPTVGGPRSTRARGGATFGVVLPLECPSKCPVEEPVPQPSPGSIRPQPPPRSQT